MHTLSGMRGSAPNAGNDSRQELAALLKRYLKIRFRDHSLVANICGVLLISSTLAFAASSPAAAESTKGQINMTELSHDQGPLFCDQLEPSSTKAVAISIRCLRDDISGASLKYYDEADRAYHALPMKKSASNAAEARFEFWQAKIPASKSCKHYHFILRKGSAIAFYNALGSASAESDKSDFKILPDFHTPQWLRDGVIYQIFPDRFFDGDESNNIKTGDYVYAGSKTIHKEWNESPVPKKGENTELIFFGGDLAGVKAKLSYIRETVGANIVYLNPVFEAPSNHKYDTSDYMHVASCLGDADSLAALASALHQDSAGRKGYLILDAVFNHTGDSHMFFRKHEFKNSGPIKGAYQSRSSPYFSYYSFTKWPDKYATFLTVKNLPKLDYGSAALRKAMYQSKDSVAQHYLRAPFNIDGWRLDAPEYVDSGGKQGNDSFDHSIWRDFRKAIKTNNPQAVILGENWHDASAWLSGGDQWDSCTNFAGFTQPIARWITGHDYDDKAAKLSVTEFDRALRQSRALYPFNVQQSLSNHLCNHDIMRFAQRAQGDAGKISLALTFQMTYVGVPTLYYGDEYGMMGGKDPDDRRTFDWAQDNGKNELIALTHKLIELRNKYSALRAGSFISLVRQDQSNTCAFGRMDKNNKIAVALNADSVEHEISIPVYELEIPEGAELTDEISGAKFRAMDGRVSVTLPQYKSAILVQ